MKARIYFIFFAVQNRVNLLHRKTNSAALQSTSFFVAGKKFFLCFLYRSTIFFIFPKPAPRPASERLRHIQCTRHPPDRPSVASVNCPDRRVLASWELGPSCWLASGQTVTSSLEPEDAMFSVIKTQHLSDGVGRTRDNRTLLRCRRDWRRSQLCDHPQYVRERVPWNGDLHAVAKHRFAR